MNKRALHAAAAAVTLSAIEIITFVIDPVIGARMIWGTLVTLTLAVIGAGVYNIVDAIWPEKSSE